MSRRSPRRRGRTTSTSNAIKFIISGVTIVACILAVVAIGIISRRSMVPIDQTTLCRTDQPPPSVLAILVDVTDELSALERTQVFNAIERIQQDLPTHGLLEVYMLGETPQVAATPRVSVCNPGRGADMNALYQNPKLAEQRWKHAFHEPVTAALAEVTQATDATQSPIMESIRSVAVALFGRPEFDAADRRLVVVSDLLQHSPLASHYRGVPDFEQFRSTSAFAAASAPLAGIRVDILYISRPGSARLQTREHIGFWEAYFAANGADLQSVKRIHGD